MPTHNIDVTKATSLPSVILPNRQRWNNPRSESIPTHLPFTLCLESLGSGLVASDQSAFEATREIRNERAGETEDMHVSLNDEDDGG